MTKYTKHILAILIIINVMVWAPAALAAKATQYVVCQHRQDGDTITLQGFSCPIGYKTLRTFYRYE